MTSKYIQFVLILDFQNYMYSDTKTFILPFFKKRYVFDAHAAVKLMQQCWGKKAAIVLNKCMSCIQFHANCIHNTRYIYGVIVT